MQPSREVIDPTPAMASDRHTRLRTIQTLVAERRSIKLVRAIYLVVGVAEAVLLIPFLLKALGANAEAGFAQFIYGVTGPLVAPFLGLFGTPQAASGATLELHTLIALVIYALVGWLVARGAWLVFGGGRSASVASTDMVQARIR